MYRPGHMQPTTRYPTESEKKKISNTESQGSHNNDTLWETKMVVLYDIG